MTCSRGITFVSMPFFPPFSANYATEYLGDVCRKAGVRTSVLNPHFGFGIDLLRRDRAALLDALQSVRYLGDLLVLARRAPSRAEAILSQIPRDAPWGGELTPGLLQDFYTAFNGILESTLAEIVEAGHGVLGLSATHYQLVSSLWLAERVREVAPEIAIVLGGYLSSPETCEDLLERHECLDVVVYGEGEEIIVPLIDSLTSNDRRRRVVQGSRVQSLAGLPKYDAFLEMAEERQPDTLRYLAPCFEVSRGCYWDRCDFCNFNVAYGRFRKFNASTVLDEMERLSSKFGVRRFHLLDTSLPPSFAGHCAGRGSEHWDVFVEIMVDWNTPRLEALRRFGVQRAQVGIESFSDSHLRSMNKNAEVDKNLTALTACAEVGIRPVYGLLIERPGDRPEHYLEQIKVIREIEHLEPPSYLSSCDLRPGSPLYTTRTSWGAEISFPASAFDAILPAADHNCELRPSVVDWPERHDPALRDALQQLHQAVANWRLAAATWVAS